MYIGDPYAMADAESAYPEKKADFKFTHTFNDRLCATICCRHLYNDRSVGLDWQWDEVWVEDANGDVLDFTEEMTEDAVLQAAYDNIDSYRASRND